MGVVLVAGGESQLSIWKKKAHKQEAEHRRIKQEDYKREWDRLVERRRTGNATMQNPFAKQRHREEFDAMGAREQREYVVQCLAPQCGEDGQRPKRHKGTKDKPHSATQAYGTVPMCPQAIRPEIRQCNKSISKKKAKK